MVSSMRPLGARLPEHKPYVEKFPLSALKAAEIPRVPVVIGVNWYTNFDSPVARQFGTLTRYFIGQTTNLGSVRGGHCVCIKSGLYSDPLGWWDFYDQGHEGACVGFGSSRMCSLINRKRYDAKWLWDLAKSRDHWSDTNPGDDNGTSVDAAMQVLKALGHVPWSSTYTDATWQQRDTEKPVYGEGVDAYRWATTVDDVRTVLQSSLNDSLQAVPFLNSWGRDYPHITWMPYKVLERLLNENGEIALVTDR
jgi:hypothetical protein